LCVLFGFIISPRDPRALHSFPTRRSSDLTSRPGRAAEAAGGRAGAEPQVDAFLRRLARNSSWGLASTAIEFVLSLVETTLVARRSEEHSLNSSHQIISYAVFCLKKKTWTT